MATDNLSTEKRFKEDVGPLEFPEFEVRVHSNRNQLYIAGGQRWEYWYLDIPEAKALRDWLNKAIP